VGLHDVGRCDGDDVGIRTGCLKRGKMVGLGSVAECRGCSKRVSDGAGQSSSCMFRRNR
jgi:hypothetical protein